MAERWDSSISKRRDSLCGGVHLSRSLIQEEIVCRNWPDNIMTVTLHQALTRRHRDEHHQELKHQGSLHDWRGLQQGTENK